VSASRGVRIWPPCGRLGCGAAGETVTAAAREASRASTVTSFSSFQTKAVSLVIVLAVFAFALSVFDPNNCTFLAPIKEVCIDYS